MTGQPQFAISLKIEIRLARSRRVVEVCQSAQDIARYASFI